MRRQAFTLIELLVSIALFGLIAVFLFGSIDELRKQQVFFKKKESQLSQKNLILSILRTDFDRAKQVTVSHNTNKDFDSGIISGSNRSLYNIDRPNVAWVILKIDNTLIRLESSYPILLPLTAGTMYLTHSDVIGNHCEIFRIYNSAQNQLIYLKFENQAPLMIEVQK